MTAVADHFAADRLRAVWSDRKSDARPILGVDLFAGAGGFSLGSLAAGVRIVAAVELQKAACATYRHNLIGVAGAKTRLFEDDILNLEPAKMMRECQISSGDCDILLGGPPCQGFSSHRLNDAGVGDPRNQLLLRYFEFVATIRPKFFIVENVPGMLWPRHKDFVDRFYRLAKEHGYDLHQPVALNARDYGVPQARKRIFLFGRDRSQSDISWPPASTHFETPPEGGLPWNPAASVFERPMPADDENDLHMKSGPELVEAFRMTPPNGGSRRDSGRLLKCHEGHGGHSDVYGRIDPSVPGPTMTTACVNPSKGRFVHPTEHHGITLRQAARFQTFPDWFMFKGGLMAGGAQVGNAVPVLMAKVLVEPIVSELQARHFDRELAAA